MALRRVDRVFSRQVQQIVVDRPHAYAELERQIVARFIRRTLSASKILRRRSSAATRLSPPFVVF